MRLEPEIEDHYNLGYEDARLESGSGRIEFLRTLEIIQRFLPSGTHRILDVGGGTGPYAIALAQEGHRVALIDAAPIHIEVLGKKPESALLESFGVGNALALNQADESFDAVMLLGPLYHLVAIEDRLTALREAMRVLKPGGVVFGAAVSKFASLLHGYMEGLVDDPEFQSIVDQDLIDGQHRNPTNHPRYFTTTKFHEPSEFESEFVQAGFRSVEVLAVESFSWLFGNIAERDEMQLLHHLKAIEGEKSLLGVSSHLLAIGQKPL